MKKTFIASAFFLFSVIVSELYERVGIRVELLPFRDLIADQNFCFWSLRQISHVLLLGFSEFFHSPVSEFLVLLFRHCVTASLLCL